VYHLAHQDTHGEQNVLLSLIVP